MCWNLVRYFKSFNVALEKTIFCRAIKASVAGFSHSFRHSDDLFNGAWLHLSNFSLPFQECLFCTWKMMLVHFSRRSISSPSHVAHARQKWLHMDFIHLLSSLHDFFCAALRILDLMFLQKCHTSNWCSISLRSSRRYFFTDW